MTDRVKSVILRMHNLDRNVLAGGRVRGLPGARAMPTLQWDNELAYLARINAMQCHFGHDQCHNTARYHWSGQNIAWSGGLGNDMQAIRSAIDGWWKEYRQTRKSDIDHFGNSRAMIGHFTAMAQDRTDRVGCGAVRYNRNQRIVVCNYSFTNLRGSYVYRSGRATSGCKTGKNPSFPNLCSTREKVNPNP
ncbi:antigen 5 like allergen Cul n 1-like [Culicoides brevitarsis]|uniref:antigen 5 like allergen Cul n 1-like n=1 Tax=Culicoides brevitarsis TaxID=469753 RepID=UPI00307B6E43